MTTLTAWRAALKSLDADCPWPGARPLDRDDDDDWFIGRRDEVRDFTRLVFNTDVVVLTGRTGVGKSSLLKSGLRPELERRHFHVLSCNFSRLAGIAEVESAGQLIASLAKHQLPEGVSVGVGQPPLERQLDELYPNTAVILLDQFEELIRYQPDIYADVLRWIHATASTTRVRIVIALRIEFEHQLYGHGGLELGPFQQTRMELPPIYGLEGVQEIIQNKRTTADSITEDAVKAVLDAWEDSGAVQGHGDIGLLHLQALLYALWAEVSGRQITADHVEAMRMAGGHTAADLFRYGLSQYVSLKLKRCRDACLQPGVALDRVLTERTSALVETISTHLSSGGYKVPQSINDLAELVLFGEPGVDAMLADLHSEAGERARNDLAAMFARATDQGSGTGDDGSDDWLSMRRSALLGESDAAAGRPWNLDPTGVTAGPLFGLRPLDSAIEEYRTFYFALEWLRICSLVSIVSASADKTMVQLVHDGFDAGLARWRAGLQSGFATAILRVTALHGERFDWRTMPTGSLDGELLVNLRWTSCEVSARWRGVTFVNCDFTGTSFTQCTFDGVAFVNCVLDDVEFYDCTVRGRPNPPPQNLTAGQLKSQPAFYLEAAGAETLRSLTWYREDETSQPADGLLFSETSGVAALPARHLNDDRAVPFGSKHATRATQPGGLTMFGSRLSSLKIRACTFENDSWIALRHVAGTSLEIAEQTHARVEVFAAALRGLTVTRPIDAADAHRSDEPAPFELRFEEAHIVNTWFGVGLVGSAEIRNSRIWQLFNASDTFTVQPVGSEVYGAVNIETPQGEQREDKVAPSLTSLGGLEADATNASQKLDYRRHPARFEVRED